MGQYVWKPFINCTAHGEVTGAVESNRVWLDHRHSLGNFMLDLGLPYSGKPWLWIQSQIMMSHAIRGDEVASHHLSQIILKSPFIVLKEPDFWELLEGPHGHLSASSFCYEKTQLIDFTDVYRSVHQRSSERVIFTFRIIFSFWIMGWWGKKWSWLLTILKSLQAE